MTKEKKITIKLADSTEITFKVSSITAESVMEKLFEEGTVENETARNVALNSKEIDAVINVLVYHIDSLTKEDIETIYNRHQGEPRVVGEIASLDKTPAWIIKALLNHSDDMIQEMAETEWEQREPCPQCKGSGKKSACIGLICGHCKGAGKV